MNKIIIGLLAAVVVLGMALVVLNNQLNSHHSDRDLATPLSARDMLPEIPDLHGVQARIDESAEGGTKAEQQEEPRLMALPKLPDAIEPPATTLRAPVSTATLSREKTPVQAAVQSGVQEPAQSATALAMNENRVQGTAQTAPVSSMASSAAASAAALPAPAAGAQIERTASVQTGSVQTGTIQDTTVSADVKRKSEPAPVSVQETDRSSARDEKPVRAEKSAQVEQSAQPAETAAHKAEKKPSARTEAPGADRGNQKDVQKGDARKNEQKTEQKVPSGDVRKDVQKDEQKGKKAAAQPKMVVFVREKGATVRLSLNRDISYKTMLLSNPDRLVVDITGENRDLKAPGIPANDMVSNVRLGHYPNRTRIVVDLKEAPKRHRLILSEDRDRLDIRVDR